VVVVQTPPYCVGLNLVRTTRYDALAWAQVLFDLVVGTMGPMRSLLQVVLALAQVSHSLLPDTEDAKARRGR